MLAALAWSNPVQADAPSSTAPAVKPVEVRRATESTTDTFAYGRNPRKRI